MTHNNAFFPDRRGMHRIQLAPTPMRIVPFVAHVLKYKTPRELL